MTRVGCQVWVDIPFSTMLRYINAGDLVAKGVQRSPFFPSWDRCGTFVLRHDEYAKDVLIARGKLMYDTY